MWMEAAGALIGAASDIYSGRQSAKAAERNYRHRYQWQVEDLRKAGLNPMLAVSQGPGSVAQPQFPTGGAVEGARAGSAAALAREQRALVQSQKEVADATRNKTIEEGTAIRMQNLITEAGEPYQSAKLVLGDKGQVTGPSARATERWQAEIAQITSAAEKAAADTSVSRIEADVRRQELTVKEVQAKYAKELAAIEVAYRDAMRKAAEAGVPAAQADAAFWEKAEGWGKAAIFLKQILGGIK